MRHRWIAFLTVGLAALGVAAMVVPELVVWSGQPAPDALEGDVLQYYGQSPGRIRFGDAMWIAGVVALLVSAALIRHGMPRTQRRVFLGGLATCGALLAGSAIVAWFLAGDAAAGTLGGSDALIRWQLEGGLFGAGSNLLVIPLVAGAFGVDRERPGGTALMAAGMVIGVSLVLPLGPWNVFAALAWLVWLEAFFATSPSLAPSDEVALRWRPRPAVA